MRRLRATFATLGLVLVLVLAFVPAAIAAPEQSAVEGTWAWVNTLWEPRALPNGAEIGYGEEIGTWTGGFSGTSFDTFKAVFQPGGGGFGVGTLWVYFDGEVNGTDGEMLMRITFLTHNDGSMSGQWAIVKGWDGLEGLSGHGSWIIEGDEAAADYSGVVQMK